MIQNFIEIDVNVSPEFSEIILAELAEIGFDSFMESNSGILGYIEEENLNDVELKHIFESYASKTSLFYSLKKVEKQNWNEEWESSFQPIDVDGKIYVRATFHEAKNNPIDIIITPKMSFGTGHHETTYQVMQLQLLYDHKEKSVLDVGTGTGILAILASKLGSNKIHAFDIDDWSVENTIENIELNHSKNISVSKGTIKDQIKEKYDIVLANINRNILLDEMNSYVDFMKPNGKLFVSGFYDLDAQDIINHAGRLNLRLLQQSTRNQWAALVFEI
ncbi:MAG: 50S ribosomal protein L11 methyltransferase [Leadbetterella sp.]